MKIEPWGKKARLISDATSSWEKNKWWYTCRLFRLNSLKEGAM
jgi:hypothetical protein